MNPRIALFRQALFLLPLLLALAAPGAPCPAAQPDKAAPVRAETLRDGDIIFQSSTLSTQNLAIQLATRSRYSHCGIIFFRDGKPLVFEAIRTVSWTPLEAWIARGVDSHYVVMRLKDADSRLGPEKLAAMRAVAGGFAGRGYDLFFQWTDDTIYCSELVWKIYERGAGIELAPLRRIRDYDLNHAEVQRKIKERFGYDIPWEEQVIAPSDLMESDFLETVADG